MKLIQTLLLSTFAFTAATAFAAQKPAEEEKVIVSTQELPEATSPGTESDQPTQPAPVEAEASGATDAAQPQ